VSNVLVAEEELKALLVGELGLVDEAEFERARLMATRLKMPLERAVAERPEPRPFSERCIFLPPQW